MNNEHYYDVTVNWKSDRRGVLISDVLSENIEVATPPEFSKGVAGVWSPEHLFVAAVNSCLMTTFLAIAENSQLEFLEFSSKAVGKLEKQEGKFLMSEVVLTPRLVISNEADTARALRILEKSEAACLISNSIKSTIVFQPKVTIASVA
jgi:peroxiredoxin-like protein